MLSENAQATRREPCGGDDYLDDASRDRVNRRGHIRSSPDHRELRQAARRAYEEIRFRRFI